MSIQLSPTKNSDKGVQVESVRRMGCSMLRLSLFAAGSCLFLLGTSAEAATYYVSPSGDNTTGTSYKTAWKELDQIKWSKVKDGDYILLDGGAKSVKYYTTLTIPNLPHGSLPTGGQVFIYQDYLNAGHTGQVILEGSGNKSGVAINFLGHGDVYGNGRFFDSCTQGILVENFKNTAVVVHGWGGVQGMTFRSNGTGVASAPTSGPTGVTLCIFRDCSYAGVALNSTSLSWVNQCWFYNSTSPQTSLTQAGITGLTATSCSSSQCIFGPNLNYGIYQSASASINDGAYFSLDNALLLDASKANLNLCNTSYGFSVTNLTSFSTPKNALLQSHVNLAYNTPLPRPGFANSVFYGAGINVPVSEGFIGDPNHPNDEFNVTGNTTALAAKQVDPMFKSKSVYTLPNNVSATTLINTDFSVSQTPNLGSSLTSVSQFLAQKFGFLKH